MAIFYMARALHTMLSGRRIRLQTKKPGAKAIELNAGTFGKGESA